MNTDEPAAISDQTLRVLIVDLVGLRHGADGHPDASEVRAHVLARGAHFHDGALPTELPAGVHFSYQPALFRREDLLACAGDGQFDAVIAAATTIPEACVFPEGGVRIGAGTGNMASLSWGGPSGDAAAAPLMNTPSFNSRATAQMTFRALLRVRPDLPVNELSERVSSRDFDTGRDLLDYPTTMLAGQRLGVLGFGNIGRAVANLGAAFGMQVAVYARPTWRPWIEAAGFEFADSPLAAARGSDVLSVHLGLGVGGANVGLVGAAEFDLLQAGAVVLNYDRGELLDVDALAAALAERRVDQVAVDADLFTTDGTPSGPLAPYLRLADAYPDRVHLLPHAAADTDHPSRVAGACQAIDQLLLALRERVLINVVGSVPVGYRDGGAVTVPGVGPCGPAVLQALAMAPADLARLRADLASVAQLLDGLNAAANPDEVEADGAALAQGVLSANRLVADLRRLGLAAPFTGGAIR